MSLKKLLISNGPTIMILVIAVAAAYGGFVEGKTADNIQGLQLDVKNQEQKVDNLIKESEQYILEDIDYLIRGIYYLDEAFQESAKYLTAADANEELAILIQVAVNIDIAQQWFERTYAFAIFDYFETSSSDLLLFSDDTAITKSEYDDLEEDLYIEFDAETYLKAYGLEAVDELIAITGPQTIAISNAEGLTELLSIPIVNAIDELNDLNADLFDDQAKQSALRRAISIITVATVLSAAMASRLRFRKTKVAFSEVRADINKDEKLLISQGDLIAGIVLGLAVLIATIGLFLAI